ncbi:MAG: 2Fe-2S iron-sulfur cluster-binding protein, partial [Candidatus Thermoplasmatota archaeon]|nr:2Fe-2S iron-sulfur cluster-binding protein [Candidatus Thermoplasmatota archaeon]
MKDTSFYFNGRLYRAPENLTVAEALIHNNKFIFGRSIRYHRARSYFCGKGLCSHCMVSIDGIGNVRSCITPLKEGMKIDSQNYLLSVNFDPLRFIDYVFNPYFNYARTKLTRSFMAPLFNYAMRKIAGTEILPEKVTIKKSEKLEVHVLVIGAGKYGTETAIVSSEFGAKVALIDTVPDIRYDDRAMPYINKGTLKIYPYTSAIYLSKTDTGWITGLFTRDRTYIEVNSHAVVIATGTEPSLPLFGNNDLPGIMTHSAFEKLIDKGVDINGRVAVEIHNKIPYSIMEKLKKRRINTVFIKNDEINAELSGYGEVVVGNIKYAYGGSRIAGIVTDRNDKIKAAMVAVDDRDH